MRTYDAPIEIRNLPAENVSSVSFKNKPSPIVILNYVNTADSL